MTGLPFASVFVFVIWWWQLNFLLRLMAKATLRWLVSWGDLFAALPLTSRF